MLFFPPVSYSAVSVQSIDCFCSSCRSIASLLARFALVRRRNCFCSYSRQFRFSPSIVYALPLACSASDHRLFCRLIASLLASFALVRRLFSRPFCFSPSIVSALLVDRSASVRRFFMLFSSINRFSSRQFRSSLLITSALLLMDLGGVRRKMAHKNCERINAVKTVNSYVFLKRWYTVGQRIFFNGTKTLY